MNNLKQEKHVKQSSSIAPLSLFISSAGLICVVGRYTDAAYIPPNSKHQILILKYHPIAT